MKKNYIIPSTESIAFHAGPICETSPGTSGMNIGGGTLGGGGDAGNSSTPIDPM